jgi:hypothetical protein
MHGRPASIRHPVTNRHIFLQETDKGFASFGNLGDHPRAEG